jgi:SPP1 gp7 family putative phage head morphogenesis protein
MFGFLKSLFGASKAEDPTSTSDAPPRQSLSVDVFSSEPHLVPILREVALVNARKIPGVTAANEAEIAEKAFSAMRTGRSVRELGREFKEIFGLTTIKAGTEIASGQIIKLQAKMTQIRHEAQGIERYEWSAVMDARESEECKKLNGKRFRWDKPPKGGHPGERDGCRCHAQPVIPELDDLFK